MDPLRNSFGFKRKIFYIFIRKFSPPMFFFLEDSFFFRKSVMHCYKNLSKNIFGNYSEMFFRLSFKNIYRDFSKNISNDFFRNPSTDSFGEKHELLQKLLQKFLKIFQGFFKRAFEGNSSGYCFRNPSIFFQISLKFSTKVLSEVAQEKSSFLQKNFQG